MQAGATLQMVTAASSRRLSAALPIITSPSAEPTASLGIDSVGVSQVDRAAGYRSSCVHAYADVAGRPLRQLRITVSPNAAGVLRVEQASQVRGAGGRSLGSVVRLWQRHYSTRRSQLP